MRLLMKTLRWLSDARYHLGEKEPYGVGVALSKAGYKPNPRYDVEAIKAMDRMERKQRKRRGLKVAS